MIDRIRPNLDMLVAGMSAFKEWNPERDPPEALVWEILWRSLVTLQSELEPLGPEHPRIQSDSEPS